MQNPPRINHVKGLIRKGQSLGISHPKFGTQSEQIEPSSGVFHGAIGQINSRQPCTALGKTLMICTQPDADLQYIQITSTIKASKLLDVRLQGIALCHLCPVAGLILRIKQQFLAA